MKIMKYHFIGTNIELKENQETFEKQNPCQ